MGQLTQTTVQIQSVLTAVGNVAGVSPTNTAAVIPTTALTDALALKAPLASPTFTGTVGGITKAMVGLGNVDNILDINKPVSIPQAAAIALKQDTIPIYATLSLVPTNFTGRAFVGGVDLYFNNGYLLVSSVFRLTLAGTGAVSVDVIDHLGVVTLNAFAYSLPTDIGTGIKKFDAETIVGIKITYSVTATVTYLR